MQDEERYCAITLLYFLYLNMYEFAPLSGRFGFRNRLKKNTIFVVSHVNNIFKLDIQHEMKMCFMNHVVQFSI